MQSAKRQVRINLLTPTCAMLALTGCVGAPRIVAAPGACSALLPTEWREPLPGATLPDGNTVGDWIQFADTQTGQLDKANDRTTSAIGIVERCEARDAAAIAAARRPWWRIW